MDLPSALNLPADRRERLLERANREMHAANMQSNPRYWWTGVLILSAELLLYDAFLILLLLRLTLTYRVSWYTIAIPIWILLVQSGTRDILKFIYHRPSMTIHYLIFRIIYDTCISLALLTTALKLSGVIGHNVPWIITLIPLWIEGILNSLYLAFAPGPNNIDEESLREYRSNMWYSALIHFGAFGLQAGLIVLKIDGYMHGSWSNIFIPSFLALIFLVIALAGTSLHLIGVFCPSCLRLRALSAAQRVVFAVLILLAILSWIWLVCIFQSFESLVSVLSTNVPTSKADISSVILPLIVVISATVILLPLLVAGLVAAGVNQTALAAAAGRTNGMNDSTATLTPLSNSVRIVRQSSMYFKRASDLLSVNPSDVESQYDSDLSERSDIVDGMPKKVKADKQCYVCESKPPNAVLLECGHGGICYECGQGLVKQRSERSCPICRMTIDYILKLPDGVKGKIGQRIEAQEGVTVTVANLQNLFVPTPPASVPRGESNSDGSSRLATRDDSNRQDSRFNSNEPV